jgi:hypothetical protein
MSLIGPSIHVCRTLKCFILALEGNNDVLWSHLEAFSYAIRLPIRKNVNYEDSDASPIVTSEAVNLFCKYICLFFLWILYMIGFLEAYYTYFS